MGVDTVSAADAMSAALRGEYEQLESLGIGLSAATVEAQKAAMGMSGLTGEADRQATAMAVQALITDQSANAVENFAGQQEGAAFKQQQATAAFEDAAASLGEALLPAITDVLEKATEFATWASENPALIQGVVGAIAVASGAILALNAALKVARAAMIAWKAILTVVRVAQLAYATAGFLMGAAGWAALGPIALIVLGIAALIAIVILCVKNWDKILAVMKKVIGWIKDTAVAAWDKLSSAISTVVGWLKTAWDWVKKILDSGLGKIGDLIGFGGSSVEVAAVPQVATAAAANAAAARAAGPRTVNVTIQAGLSDPADVARRVRQVLADDSRRVGWAR